jgi:hypothetical protein
MALQEVTASLLRRMRTQNTALSQTAGLQCRRYASSDSPVAREMQDLEETDFVKPSEPDTKYDPLHRSRSFQGTPPSSRYVEGLSLPCALNPIPNTSIPDTSSVLPSTTAALYTLTNLLNLPMRPRASSFLVPSRYRASSKPTLPPSKPIS